VVAAGRVGAVGPPACPVASLVVTDSGLMLVTWFHGDEPERAGTYAQTLGDAASLAHYETYLRCVDLCVASFRRWNPDSRAVVVLNPRADGAITPERRAFWASIGVDQAVAANTHRPDQDLYSRWQNQTYLFDVIAAAIEGVDDAQAVAVIDSDVIIRRPLDAMAAEIRAAGYLPMEIPFALDQDVHGVSRQDLQRLHTVWSGRQLDFAPAYQGGELVAGTAAELRRLLTDVESVYRWALDEQVAGRPHPNEEAQMISLARPVHSEDIRGNRWIERIWTQPWTHRSVPANVTDIPMWHLPAEKKTGLKALQRQALATGSWFWGAAEQAWDERVQDAVGVPGYKSGKYVRDSLALAHRVPAAALRRLRSSSDRGTGVAPQR
jgi:hypothetical protein